MEGLSERAYAAQSGLSRGAVQKARKTGRLVLFADGSINAAASDARRAQATDPDQQFRSTARARGEESPGSSGTAGGVTGPGDSTSYLMRRNLSIARSRRRNVRCEFSALLFIQRPVS
jgi:hypothetical protein